jgi:regulatory protein
LEKEKFIDEARFARSFACDKFRFNKWGRRRIIMELSRKDIDRETIAEAMSVIKPEDYDSQLYNLLKTKAKTLKGDDPRADYARLLRFAGGRGFEQVDIHRCLRRLFNELPYEDYDMG